MPCLTLCVFDKGGRSSPEYKQYSEAASKLVMDNGGHPNKPYFIGVNAGNGDTINAFFTKDSPSKEDVENAFMSTDYKALILIRDVALKNL